MPTKPSPTADSLSLQDTTQPRLVEDEVLDVLIVGSGPCGLAISARLCERAPAATHTDEEHRRWRWLKQYGSKVALKQTKSGKEKPSKNTPRADYKMMVIDAEGDTWLNRWKRLFSAYAIKHLRSPMLWHVDPLDRDAMLGHAYRTGMDKDLVEIKNCVGAEVSKHQKKKKGTGDWRYGSNKSGRAAINLRDQNDYYTPSQKLFCEHCDDVVDRYNLGGGLIRQERLEDIDYSVVRDVSVDDEKLFTVTTNKTIKYAKAVVMAVGPATKASIPRTPSMPQEGPVPQATHTFDISQVPSPIIKERVEAGRNSNVLVIGGGLTSAQIADLVIRSGVTKVWHLLRGKLVLKHFDVTLEWMGKYKNTMQTEFWTSDTDEERLEMLQKARGGGSITPRFYKEVVKKNIASKKLCFMECTKLTDAKLQEADGLAKWVCQTEPALSGLPAMDYIYFATGIQTDFAALPYFQTMCEKYPIQGVGGFPCLTEELMWRKDVPLFVSGKLAALRIGPSAPNIGGARFAADWIALALDNLIEPAGGEERREANARLGLQDYAAGEGNMYSALGHLGDEDGEDMDEEETEDSGTTYGSEAAEVSDETAGTDVSDAGVDEDQK
ncbi:uncharacterized protein F5Z01DRAFT_626645 [Emericellopsis atlantica]|uniref:L-ornithine N(5)-oxygenase n=1 Tax=Emericellopsis atlantica TaxID=2614577 RepID=A0A9P7ZGX4_9HYPO|nr:uncharacterized protein F5Z01DRAFT_626645 [Emericellopsis atlantica]KAG9251948.1 hypothetical protein F5Z01DRAFT_626645 [Emericellopsis atlantica]